MGLRPLLGPPCIPPEAPPKKGFQLPQNGEGNAAIATGASFPRSARSGDLPPRRVNARVRFRFGLESVSANYQRYRGQFKEWLYILLSTSENFGITRVDKFW